MTTICPKIPLSAASPIEFDVFFDKRTEIPIIHNHEDRQLPPPTRPATSCDLNLFFGFFFDGTRNNYNLCAENEAYSNVARLYDCYPGLGVPGVIKRDPPWSSDYRHFFKVYVPGVGSPFPEVFDKGNSVWGAAAGAFGHERVAWALIQAVNNIHRYFVGDMLYSAEEIRDISRKLVLTGWNLKKESYLSANELQQGQQRSYDVLRTVLGTLHKKLELFTCPKGGRPRSEAKGKVGHIYVSTFGFSRGATKARCFLNWLRKLCQLDAEMLGCSSEFTLAGFPVEFDFLGIFDTVASVGLPSSTLLWDGHGAWADAEISLRVPPGVKCVHLVAGHEVRRSFPLDSIQVQNNLDGQSEEIIFPGVHSDVGGGYAPKEQGRGKDDYGLDMLSRIPLGVMYRKARLAGVPLKPEQMRPELQYRMEVDPEVITLFNAYLDTLPRQQGEYRNLMLDMYLPYLRWRLSWADCTTWDKLTARFDNLAKADTAHVNDLLGANLQFIEHLGYYRRWVADPRVVEQHGTQTTSRGYYPPTLDAKMVENWKGLCTALPELNAPAIIGRPLAEHEVPQKAREMFQYQIHDSFAGFRPRGTEETEILANLEKLSRQDPNSLSPTEREWVERYQETKATTGRPQVPREASTGYEPFLIGGGYLHIRRVYAGSDSDRLAHKPPATRLALNPPGAGGHALQG